jgi:predicted  nucleic acid-binding Zn-ribbon protein
MKGLSGARRVRKLRISRDGWKERAAKKQHEIKQLRGTVRDLTASREYWKQRVAELEQQVEALQQDAHSTSCALVFFGG